jgi:hypothetical protein
MDKDIPEGDYLICMRNLVIYRHIKPLQTIQGFANDNELSLNRGLDEQISHIRL